MSSTVGVVSKLAFRIAGSRRSGQRARAAIVVVAVALCTAAVWGGAGFFAASQRNETRDTSRSPVMAFDRSDGVPVVGDSLPMLNGRQFQIMWLGSTPERAPAEFGGVLPDPGKAFVSPALLEDAGGGDGFERRFGVSVDAGNVEVEWDRVLAFAGEYLAFATLPEGRELPALSWLLGFDAEGLGAPEASAPDSAAGFQLPTRPVAVPNFIDERVPSPTQALLAGLFLLVLPAVLVLAIGVSSRSELRATRRKALASLGADRRALTTFDAVETAALSLPTSVVISLVAWFLLGHITSLPAGSVQYLTGDLRPTESVSAVAWLVVLAVPVLLGAAAPKIPTWRSGPRHRRSRWSAPLLLFVPVVVSITAPLLPTEARAVPFLAVVLSVVAVVPKVCSGMLVHLGWLVGATASAARLIAARRLQSGDLRASTLMRVTTFSVVIVVVVSAVTVARALPSKGSGLPDGVVSVTVAGGLTGDDAARLVDRAPEVPLAIITLGGVMVPDCEHLARLVAQDPAMCATNPDHIVAVAEASPLGQLGPITFGRPEADAAVSQVIARVGSDGENLALQANTNGLFGPSQVLGWDSLGPNPVAGWISSLGLAAVLLLSASLILLVVSVVRFPSQSDLALCRLAASERMHLAALRWELHSVVAAGVLLGAAYGLLINSAGQPAQITRVAQWPLGIAAATAGVAISIVVETGLNATVRAMRRPANTPRHVTTGLAKLEATVPP